MLWILLQLPLSAKLLDKSSRSKVVYVAPNISTYAVCEGTLASPCSPLGARDLLRRKKRADAAGTKVLLRGGDYFLSFPLVLSGLDSGLPGKPITYTSYDNERARILGAIVIPRKAFHPAQNTRKKGVFVANLSNLGIKNMTALGGTADISKLKSELFCESEREVVPLTLAQDPAPNENNNSWSWYGYQDILVFNTTWFLYNNTKRVEESGWLTIARTSHGLYIYSHFGDSGVQACKVNSITPIYNGSHITSYNFSLNIGPSRYRSGTYRFKVIDALDLLDVPNEYWIDRSNLLLYYFPPLKKSWCRILLSVGPSLGSSSSALIEVRADSTVANKMTRPSWISFANLTFVASTKSLFYANDAEHIEISNSTFTGAGGDCVSISGKEIILKNSRIKFCGGSTIVISGGNWNFWDEAGTLFAPANITIAHSSMGYFGRWQRASPGLVWSGVAHSVLYSSIEFGPGAAVLGNGNVDCLFQGNLIESTTFEQTDRGAYYHGSSAGDYTYAWTQPGNIIRNNTFRHIKFGEKRPEVREIFSTNSVYMDDVMAHYTIEDNLFDDVDVGVLIGGGLRHKVFNNTFLSCGNDAESACIHLDNRGMNWAHELCGCRCKFGVCDAGCKSGAALGPGLAKNLTSEPDSFRFEQGLRLLRCIGQYAAPPCSTRLDLAWLHNVLSDTVGGGSCAPAHNIFYGNRFRFGNTPWVICGDINNASRFDLACRKHSELLPIDIEVWGSRASDNTFF
eukprot:UC4_evm3s317